MFDDLLKQLEKLEQQTELSIPLNTDEEGYSDRECPNTDCLFQFKIHSEDWKNICKDEVIHCPLCGHQAHSQSWWTKEQIEHGKQQALEHLQASINKGFAEGARSFNRQPQNGFITMSMKYSGGPEHHAFVPISAKEAMHLKIQCESCSTRFAVIGSAFFCPSCGFNSIERIFEDSLKKVEAKLANLNVVRSAVEQVSGKDSAELTCRSLIETGISDCAVAFQKLMESLYLQIPNTAKAPFNAFQRIDDGSKLWKQACGQGYSDWLSSGELLEINTLFNKRHLLAHTEGFVDDKYLLKSGDSAYKVGQRIVVRESDVRQMVKLVSKISSKAKENLVRHTEIA